MALTNNLGLPQPFVDAVSSDYEYTEGRYSVTSLLKGTREAILQRRHHKETETDVADMVWAIFGTAVHKVLEQSNEAAAELKETWLEVEVPGTEYRLSGIFDLFNAEEKKVTDYKTASVWKVIHNDWEDYRKQLLIYCWMLRQIGFEANKGEIVALLKDHSKSKAKFDKEYPQHPVHIQRFDFTEEDFKEIEKFIVEKFQEIIYAETLKDDELPICSPSERWARPSKYAVMKIGRKKAIKLYDSREEAQLRAENENEALGKAEYYVEHRPGTNPKCEEYCSVCKFCSFYKANYQ